MKILFVTQWFEPEPSIKNMLFIRELVARGHQVEVLTGFPNYPGGKVYPGYRIRPWMRETMENIPVLRVALYPSHDRSGLRRIMNYGSFALSAMLLGTFLTRKADLIYVYHPPMTVGLAASVIGLLRRTPFVIDIQDLWPDTVAVSGMMGNSSAIGLLGSLCNYVYRRAQRISVLSPGFRKRLIDRGVPAGKIGVIYNWCDEKAMTTQGVTPVRIGSADRFTILFAGVMGFAQDIDSVLEAARICRSTVPRAEFLFIGGGVEKARLERTANDMGLENVKFLAARPMHEMGPIFAGIDALLVHLKDDPLFAITIPSKTQAYLAAGRPVVMGVRGDAADLVAQADAGILCEPGNPESIASAVAMMAGLGPDRLETMGRNGRTFYQEQLSIERGVGKFVRLFEDAVESFSRNRQKGWRFWIKVLIDRGVALCGLICLSPLLVVLSAIVAVSSGWPVMFRQVRPGREGRTFRLVKFRTMSETRGSDGGLLSDESRLTQVGRFLRATSLDELPQLWNVLCGDLSLVGPRPLLLEYLPRYSPQQARRHEVLPGITGWAQVNGRNELPWEEKFALDVWYVDNWSLKLDARILLKTLQSVIKREGISKSGHATMPTFKGSPAVRDSGRAQIENDSASR